MVCVTEDSFNSCDSACHMLTSDFVCSSSCVQVFKVLSYVITVWCYLSGCVLSRHFTLISLLFYCFHVTSFGVF